MEVSSVFLLLTVNTFHTFLYLLTCIRQTFAAVILKKTNIFEDKIKYIMIYAVVF